ncbi:hydrogenase nickel incorporation protein HypB [candidate division WOR-3 bacterium]|nr:hydrogenase nickel incorporation protein HypB [candidate division WOR-3 bacterium]
MKIVKIEESAFNKARDFAKENKKLLDGKGVYAFDVMGSVGSGKTSIIKWMVRKMKNKYKIGVVAGDLTTEVDAKRIEEEAIPVVQAHTGRACHLDPGLVRKAIENLPLDDIEILFIENVGNLICPAAVPIGVHKEFVVTSVTEGPYMIKKHPYMFQRADFVAINKIDLEEAMNVSVKSLTEDLKELNPNAIVSGTNGITGEGVDKLIECMNFQL